MLRLGILSDSEIVPLWVTQAVNEISQLHTVSIVVRAHWDFQKQESDQWLFSKFKKIDNSIWPALVDFTRLVPIQLPSGVPSCKLTSIEFGDSVSVDVEELTKISIFEPDLIVYFGSKILKGEILTLTPFGIWSLLFGNINQGGRVPIAFWEWFYKAPDSIIHIQGHSGQSSKGEIIASTITKTIYVSYNRNLCAVLSKGIDLTVESVDKLSQQKKYRSVNETTRNQKPTASYREKVNKEPGFVYAFLGLFKLVFRAALRVFSKIIFRESWSLFFSASPQNFPHLTINNFNSLIPPKDRIWADPFVISKNSKHYVFIEEMLHRDKRGHLTCLVLNLAGEVETSNVIIKKPYHLSYPHIFQIGKTWYMIPESTENKTVDLYECTNFPFQWEFKRTLLSNINAVDSTPMFYEGKCWLFCSIQNRPSSSPNEDLHIYFTDDFLAGDWQAHGSNPVISDPYNARPAGKIFFHEGHWYRPSQICVPEYGYALSLNRIIELNETDYKEVRVSFAEPGWRKNLITMHTLNFTKETVFVDGILRQFRFF